MRNGIALYPGLDNSEAENLVLLQTAAQMGITRIFTSLHIPESNISKLKKELTPLLAAARHYNMEVISDISPATLTLLGLEQFSLEAFKTLGITTLRLDCGYNAKEIAAMSQNTQGIKIQLNASTLTENILSTLQNFAVDFTKIEALHNFYPREGTGIGGRKLLKKNKLLHSFGIKVGAFVPSQNRKRGPLKAGLPTLESGRYLNVSLGARKLVALGVDSVFIGDSLPSMEELTALSILKEDQVTMRIQVLTKNPYAKQLLQKTFTARVDEARDAIRAQESRGLLCGEDIEPENTMERGLGSITLDNKGYGRYMGELQLIKRAQVADYRTNVIGQILPSEEFLLAFITPGRKYGFEII
ncbi:MAG: MupG family TIM beta-alpha barrel fold protein [Acidaminococcaceae bacterium]|nr:MupG family TIM beta-alpha barrel fold protein [Acidaminococcaceae bacterium]MDD4721731.1 MupG family TIM beta-alpha barrel fold protein [Acidaminococcaceae bacterium]